ncbi:MAG: hypothetical protein EXR71_03825 [Myxococcales bacterium]|nr:hypothetical protein [Myxococcales bacterium]
MFCFLWACATETWTDAAEPEALAPLDAHDLESPSDAGDPYPERSAMVSGREDEYDWSVLRGWVKADAAAVWEAVIEPDVGVNRRDVASWTVVPLEDGVVDSSYLVNEVVVEPITVDFDLTWRHAHADDPAAGSVSVWEKTAGTEFISLMAGSVLSTGHDGVVDFLVVFHLKTVDSGTERTEQFVTDFYASVLAAAHGEALPTYE